MPVDYLGAAAAALLVTVFAVSAFGKARDLAGFAASLEPLRPVPPRLRVPAARAVAAAEAGVVAAFAGYALGVPGAGPFAFTGAFALLCVFTAVILASLRSGSSARCHCFGRTGAVYAPRHAVRNALLGTAALIGAFASASPSAPEPAGVFLAAATGVVVGVLVIAMDDVAELFA
ncbi:MauE/DoxX family redox-associated membrane protein [Nocardiopsis sp. CC223A]|uniref:MauE/DoxX family redox-associated membrane protein n=1 Tax=Nocardiopsis sp. CC223A TaxID=3044051 RepID=UPI00278BDA02|nr:MauE/DoxX family redox-associated membrane protein [Nocardiopsis sp. CC223A]